MAGPNHLVPPGSWWRAGLRCALIFFLLHVPSADGRINEPEYPHSMPPNWEPERYFEVLINATIRNPIVLRRLLRVFEGACGANAPLHEKSTREDCLPWINWAGNGQFTPDRSQKDRICIQPKHLAEPEGVPFAVHIRTNRSMNRAMKFFRKRVFFLTPQLPTIAGPNFFFMADAHQDVVPNSNIHSIPRVKTGNGTFPLRHEDVRKDQLVSNAWQARDVAYTMKYVLPHTKNRHFVMFCLHDMFEWQNVSLLLDHPLVRKVFSSNIPPGLTHPKLIPVPMGISSKFGKFPRPFLQAATKLGSHPPTKLAMFGFRAHNPIRVHLMRNVAPKFGIHLGEEHRETLENKTNTVPVIRSKLTYFGTLIDSKYVMCPQGIGNETYRTSETTYYCRIPVLLRSSMTHDSLNGLPHLVVDSYDEVTPGFLEADWERRMNDTKTLYHPERADMCYWFRFVLKHCLADLAQDL